MNCDLDGFEKYWLINENKAESDMIILRTFGFIFEHPLTRNQRLSTYKCLQFGGLINMGIVLLDLLTVQDGLHDRT